MSMIAGLQDFRQESPPADIGIYQFPCSVIIFQFAFSGTTYRVALRSGVRGWVLVSYGTSVVTVVESAWAYLAGLGGGEIVLTEADYGDMSGEIDSQGSDVILSGMGYGTYLHTGGANNVISIDGHDNVTVRDIRLAQTSVGNNNDAVVIMNGADDFRIEHVWITDSDRWGISVSGTSIYGGWIIGCRISGLDNDGIEVTMGAPANYLYYAVIWGNRISGGTDAIDVDRIYYSVLSANTVSDGSSSGIEIGALEYTVVTDNTIYNFAEYGMHIRGACYYLIVSDNMLRLTTLDGISIENSTVVKVVHNIIRSAGIYGVDIAATATDCELKDNTYIASGTAPVRDLGVGTKFDTVQASFVQYGGGATRGDEGLLVDAAGEYAIVWIHLPRSVQQVVRVRIWAYLTVTEADRMLADIRIRGATDNEPINQHESTAAGLQSATVNFAAGDIGYWSLTEVEAAAISSLVGEDQLQVRCLYAAAAGADCATSAAFQSIEIDIV